MSMRVDGINALDLASYYNYLQETGLDTYFTSSAVKNNSGQRYLQETGWRSQDLQSMMDKLNVSNNKYFIIRMMQRGDAVNLLSLLQKDQLVQALNFFPRSKLILFINFLPKDVVLKMLLSVIPLDQLLQLFPTETIFNILRSKRLQVSGLVKGFENMPLDVLQQLMCKITGKNMDHVEMPELLSMFQQLKKHQILDGMKSMPQKQLFQMILGVVKMDPQLMMMIPKGDFMNVISVMPKPNLIQLFQLLPKNTLVQFLAQLPDKFLAMAAAQLDTTTFEQVLMNQYPDLIANLAQAA